jgi:hypothetical protein
MNISKMLTELRAEREHVEQAILVLERIAVPRYFKPRGLQGRDDDVEDRQLGLTQVKRRGRPPGSKNNLKPPHRYLSYLASTSCSLPLVLFQAVETEKIG